LDQRVDDYKSTNLNLGWDKRNDYANSEVYWDMVSDVVISPALNASRFHHKTDKVLLNGDCSTDEHFQKVVRVVVGRELENKPEIYEKDPVFAAARGAAEMTKRVYWEYNQRHPVEGFGTEL
jgi:hypothetical protein